ncbi:MAG: hypothetical protein ABIV50_06485, partial [Opitutus sp.]
GLSAPIRDIRGSNAWVWLSGSAPDFMSATFRAPVARALRSLFPSMTLSVRVQNWTAIAEKFTSTLMIEARPNAVAHSCSSS